MIAISYRREDSLPIAGRLYDRLQARFGKQNVFMDFDSIPPGVDFREQIKQTIERSKLVIAVIGPRWLGEQSDSSRRIDDPADFVRLEIRYALKHGVPIIPLLVDNTLMPRPEKLPPDIEGLAFRNALPLDSGIDFHNHAERLINGICGLVDVSEMQYGHASGAGDTRPATGASPTGPTGRQRRSRLLLWGVVGVIGAIGVALSGWFVAANREQKDKSQQSLPTQLLTQAATAEPLQGQTIPPQPTSASPASFQASIAPTPSPGEESQSFAPPTAEPQLRDEKKLARVHIKRIGLDVLLPTELFPDATGQLADANTDRIKSVKGCATVAFSASRESVKTAYDRCVREFATRTNGKTIDYKILKPRWFVVSGYSRTTGFYTKGVQNGEDVAVMQLEYIGSLCNIPAETLAEISRKFDGNPHSDDSK